MRYVMVLKNPDPLMLRMSAGSKQERVLLSDEVKVPKERILKG
jgi:hypothetical protein